MRIRILVALALPVLLAAGCGFANPFAPANAASRTNAEQLALKWAQCMRQHGVNVPDPGPNGAIRIQSTANPKPAPSGAGGGSGASAGISTAGGGDAGTQTTGGGPPPEVQAAMDACKQYQPNGARSSGPPSQQQIDAMTKFTQCMRDHGIPMSDPQVSGGGITIQTSPGTGVKPDDSQFQQAQQACQHFLGQGGNGGS